MTATPPPPKGDVALFYFPPGAIKDPSAPLLSELQAGILIGRTVLHDDFGTETA